MSLGYDIKSCVAYNGEQSSFFSSFRGVRQGEILSPVLFALFLNDLETFLNFEFRYDDTFLYLKLFVLLYADDTIIFGTDEKEFQKNSDMFSELCNFFFSSKTGTTNNDFMALALSLCWRDQRAVIMRGL